MLNARLLHPLVGPPRVRANCLELSPAPIRPRIPLLGQASRLHSVCPMRNDAIALMTGSTAETG
jgi:hypothetical protein